MVWCMSHYWHVITCSVSVQKFASPILITIIFGFLTWRNIIYTTRNRIWHICEARVKTCLTYGFAICIMPRECSFRGSNSWFSMVMHSLLIRERIRDFCSIKLWRNYLFDQTCFWVSMRLNIYWFSCHSGL